ncbi:DUF2470 domain-containing protein [Streptomyces sp. NPDC049837]|uniref:DUF2470 domain-containing protein n=1 Tax=Streptomyces sp. NPDC049837 TaxID=3155277 RepID=UPI0034344708
MSAPHVPAPGPVPSSAEHVRSVLARAVSLTLTTEGRQYDLIGAHAVDRKGRVTLHPPAESPLAAHAACAPRGALAALMEFTDIAPISVRDRVRAKVALSGWLTPAGPPDDNRLRLDTARATLTTVTDTATHTVDVGLDELARAEADPLAVDEAAMLTHLADAHQDVVTRLTRLAGPRLPHGVVRVQPLALDRYGITLRCEYATNHRDVRILFPAPAYEAAQAGDRIRELVRRNTSVEIHP